MNTLGNGQSTSVTVPAGAVLKARGSGVVTFGPGANYGQQSAISGPTSIGPASADMTCYLSGTSGMRWAVYNDDAPVLAVGAYTLDPEDNGKTIECTTTLTITATKGRPTNFAVAVIPSGTTSIASDGTALLNGATTTVTRAAASNALFAIQARASAADSYVVTGS